MYRSLYVGDYRYRHQGDIFGSIGKFIGGVAKVGGKLLGAAGSVLPGPIGTAAKIGGKVLGGAGGIASRMPVATGVLTGIAASNLPVLKSGIPIAGGAAQINPLAFLPGGKPFIGAACPSGRYNQDGSCRKRPSMNPANPRALRRAIRRQAGFVKLARRALRGSGYVIASRGSRTRKVGARRR